MSELIYNFSAGMNCTVVMNRYDTATPASPNVDDTETTPSAWLCPARPPSLTPILITAEHH